MVENVKELPQAPQTAGPYESASSGHSAPLWPPQLNHALGSAASEQLIASEQALQQQTAIAAGKVVAQLYHLLQPLYPADDAQSLNKLCVRLVFCWYADAAKLWGATRFHDYLQSTTPDSCPQALSLLFSILNTPEPERGHMDAPLEAFPYVNGGLFHQEPNEVQPQLTPEVHAFIIHQAGTACDWSQISPTIFGAVFESTLNPQTRRVGGMHYTSLTNIHKVIDPLFLNALRDELETYLKVKRHARRTQKLISFQNKLAELKFLDPACGSGNFLTETFVCLRRLENQVIRELYADQAFLDIAEFNPVKVSLSQFVGIEINDFAVVVAQTALWIAECQMLAETNAIIDYPLEPFPLYNYDNIVQGNALTTPWEQVVPLKQLSYIIGNPPFSSARMMSAANKQDLKQALGPKWPTKAGDLDLVCGWLKKAHDVMLQAPHIKTAFVATNSICQGSAVANLWQPLLEGGSEITFAHRSFLWDSSANDRASVYCVIVGLAHLPTKASKLLFTGDTMQSVPHINGYLMAAPDAFIRERSKPLCPVPESRMGNQPLDGGHYLFTTEEKDAFLKREPQAAPYLHRWYGSRELLQGKERYCLYLGACSEADLAQMPEANKRVEAVRQYRLQSKAASTRKLAATPTQFNVTCLPSSSFLVIPEVSSANRYYIPVAFMRPEDGLCSNLLKLFPETNLYHFSVLSSTVHMVWVKRIAPMTAWSCRPTALTRIGARPRSSQSCISCTNNLQDRKPRLKTNRNHEQFGAA